ncbi:phage major tail tube protein [Lachnospiraceae bacterium OttesenSCG-928-E19]|nr:phage major tail tube protein [Lachnospiraceae bacterium OttesenSCG-928-E19]
MPKILKNFNLFVDGRGYAGRADEVTPPKLTIKTEEIRAGGMDAPAEVDMGMEKIETSFSLIEYDPDILTQFGVVSGNSVSITLRGALVKLLIKESMK